MSLKAKLKAASKMWGKASKRAEKNEGGFGEEWPDGRYSVQITKASINESQSSGRLQASLTYKGLEGEMKGKTIMSHDGLETEDNLMFFARKLKAAGQELPDDFDEIEDALKVLEKKKPKVRIRVKTNGEFQNVYIDKPLSDDDVEDAGGSDDTSEEEVELKKGMKVTCKIDGEDVECTVIKVKEDDEKAVVKDEDGEKHTVSFDDIEVPDSDDEDEDEDSDDDEDDDEDDDDGDDDDDEPKSKKKKSSKDEDEDEDDDDDEDEEEDEDDDDDDDDEDDEPKKGKVSKKSGKLKKK